MIKGSARSARITAFKSSRSFSCCRRSACGNPVKQIGFDVGDLFVCRDCFDGPTDDELNEAAVDAKWGV